jgi:glycine/D-amino acid oxidase-like deaminating enzyme
VGAAELALISLRMFQNWQEVVGQPGEFRKTGFVRIVHPNESARLKSNVEMQRRLGAKVDLISKEDLHELEPDWNVEEVEWPPTNRIPGTVTALGWLEIS